MHRARSIPNEPADMFRPLLALLLVAAVLPVWAEERDDGLSTISVFACGTGEDASEGMLALRGGTTEDGSIRAIQFVEEDQGIETAPWPVAGTDGKARMVFSNTHGEEGYLFVVRWNKDGLAYALFSQVKPKNEDGIAEGNAGLVVSDAEGTVQRTVLCSERPSVYLDLLSEATSCDLESPMGAASCDLFNPPTRTMPLSVLYPWLPVE
jgi:hypothetical protein